MLEAPIAAGQAGGTMEDGSGATVETNVMLAFIVRGGVAAAPVAKWEGKSSVVCLTKFLKGKCQASKWFPRVMNAC